MKSLTDWRLTFSDLALNFIWYLQILDRIEISVLFSGPIYLSCKATPCFGFPSAFHFVSNIGLSDTAVMDMMVSTLQQQRAVTEQLRREAAIKRIPVSVAVADIVKYISEHEQEDCLLVGFSSQKVNPFREKSSCTVL